MQRVRQSECTPTPQKHVGGDIDSAPVREGIAESALMTRVLVTRVLTTRVLATRVLATRVLATHALAMIPGPRSARRCAVPSHNGTTSSVRSIVG